MSDKLFFKCNTQDEFFWLIGVFEYSGFNLDYDSMVDYIDNPIYCDYLVVVCINVGDS